MRIGSLVFALVLCAGLATVSGCREQPSGATPADASAEATSQAEAIGEEAGEETARAAPDTDTGVDSLVEDSSAHPLGSHVADRYAPSLATVVETRFLRVLTSRNSFDYFIHAAHPGGYQYEMVKGFTRFLNKRHTEGKRDLAIQFELIPVDDHELIPMLLAGAGDLIAARLTVLPERADQVRFSRPYRSVDEIVVTHGGTGPHASLADLSGKRVYVRPSSSYYDSLVALNETLEQKGLAPVRIQAVDEALETERILELVAARHFDYSVADSIVAELAASIHPELRLLEGLEIRRGGQLAWATAPSADALAKEMDIFLDRYDGGSLLGNLAIQKYFEADNRLIARLSDQSDGSLSDYDAIFKQQSKRFGLDWRLMAAMAYQESRFDPLARNRSGAVGLFQIKPVTAREPYIGIQNVKGIEHVEQNITAGIKYLAWIKGRYFDSNPKMRERDRVRMALAAYNAGPRRILTARRRAKELGLDPDKWFRNVELALIDMRRMEPVKYVSDINQRYVSYMLLGIE